ncbi:thioester reductase domain-containing protein [Pendulispora albinea]|uniref:Thioester reductase domain-containing protein n=1 Tax=Pendulispora albinea TaxID=2741071 RepID=A0ABZ2LWA5_9BACT
MKSAQTEVGIDNLDLFELSCARAADMLEADPQLRRSVSSRRDSEAMLRECRYTIEFLERACQLFADRPALAHRGMDEPANAPFTSLTYAELWERIRACAAGLNERGWVRRGDFVGVLGFSGVSYIVAQYACFYLGAVVAPLPTILPAGDLEQVLDAGGFSTLIVDADDLEAVRAILPTSTKVRHVAVMNAAGEGWPGHERDRDGRAAFEALSVLEARGRTLAPIPYFVPAGEEDPLQMFLYTSGSTGLPKAVMFTQRGLATHLRRALEGELGLEHEVRARLPRVEIRVSFMPQNHLMGQLNAAETLLHGGCLHFTRMRDMSSLFEDIRLARPTRLTMVPRVAEMIHHVYQNELARRAGGEPPTPDLRQAVERAMREHFLGDRLLLIRVGSAPIAADVREFLQRTFQVPVFDVYGSTEAGYLMAEGRPLPNVSYTLRDVPELGYLSSDRPYPRGELRVKTPSATPGYFRNPEATRDLIDDEGYVCTGDIVEQRGPEHLVWVDRKSNTLKLAQGEFVSLWRLESIYASDSPYISQIYLYADSFQSHILAVIVPEHETVAKLDAGLLDAGALRRLLGSELQRIAKKNQLQPYEVPPDFLVEREAFTQQNGLLTESSKPARQKLKAKYRAQLDALYAELRTSKRDELSRLREDGERPLGERVEGALRATLGADSPRAGSFRELGGDSMSAAELSALLAELTGVNVPVGMILDPAGSPFADLVPYIAAQKAQRAQIAQRDEKAQKKPGSAKTHHEPNAQVASGSHVAAGYDPSAATVRAVDLTLEAFLDPREIAEAERLPRVPGPPKSALLTGANGFLGRFLALELLDQLPPDGRLYCIVRARSNEAALARMCGGSFHARALQERLAAMAKEGRLVVLAGDLMKPQLGLDDGRWHELAETVDAIVHAGALVNHALSYGQLFEPNVLGTVQIARLAITRKRKSIHFVSSVSVGGGLKRRTPITEGEDALALCTERPASGGYASGYGATKWACEVFLQRLSERFGGPVDVFRCGMILAHSEAPGEINVDDMFSRLLVSLMATGIAPRSFYAPEFRESGRFHGLPVDFVAKSLTAIALQSHQGYATYHVVSDDEGSVSLDRIVDWVQEKGYPLERIDDYHRWYQTFGGRLERLDSKLRAESAYAIRHQWAHPLSLADEPAFDVRRYAARIAALGRELGGPARLPAITQRFIQKSIEDLRLRRTG